MGLDVYLVKIDNKEEVDRLRALYNKYSNEAYKWDDPNHYNSLTKEEKDAIAKKVEAYAVSLGLDKYGEPKESTAISIDSKISPKHAEHMFKIGYLRSSYNSGGINNVLRKVIGKDLYTIFKDEDTAGDGYEFSPDWGKSLVVAKEMLAELKAFAEANPYSTYEFGKWGLATSVTAKEAIELVSKAIEKDKTDKYRMDWYSSGRGDFFISGMKVLGLFRGEGTATLAVYQSVDENGNATNPYDWYIEALEITIEMIEWVLNQPDPHKYYLQWSS